MTIPITPEQQAFIDRHEAMITAHAHIARMDKAKEKKLREGFRAEGIRFQRKRVAVRAKELKREYIRALIDRFEDAVKEYHFICTDGGTDYTTLRARAEVDIVRCELIEAIEAIG